MEVKVKHFTYPVLIQPTQIRDLIEIEDIGNAIKIGASVTLLELESALQHQIDLKHGN